MEAKHLPAHTEKGKTKKKDRKVASIAVSAAGRSQLYNGSNISKVSFLILGSMFVSEKFEELQPHIGNTIPSKGILSDPFMSLQDETHERIHPIYGAESMKHISL
jgi:hypothetical protein